MILNIYEPQAQITTGTNPCNVSAEGFRRFGRKFNLLLGASLGADFC